VLLEVSLSQIARIAAGSVLSHSIFFPRQQILIHPNMLQQLKGQDGHETLLEGSTKGNPKNLSVLNAHTSKLDETSSILSVLPNQVQTEFRR
jgi:hypothetical protein